LINTIIISYGIFPYAKPSLIFVILVLFNLTFFPYTIIITSLFNTKVTAIVAGIVLYFITF